MVRGGYIIGAAPVGRGRLLPFSWRLVRGDEATGINPDVLRAEGLLWGALEGLVPLYRYTSLIADCQHGRPIPQPGVYVTRKDLVPAQESMLLV